MTVTRDQSADSSRLSTLDRFLSVWIGLAMIVGLVLGHAIPDLDDALDNVKIDTVSLPIALGLLLMMYPVLAKVKYARLGRVVEDKRTLVLSLVLNWIVGPAIMWFGSFAIGMKLGLAYETNTSVAFTAAGNNFELAIAVAIGVFGVSSGQALAGVVGPLIEVPVLVGLVYVSLAAKRRLYDTSNN